MRGQNSQRPAISSAGSRVIAATNADAMPMAPTGPSERLEFRSDSSRHSNPMMTVPALAAIGSRQARQARVMAVQVDVDPGQLLPVPGHQQQAVVGGRADHQDEQDALALPVQGDDVVLGQQVDDAAGQRQPADRGEQHHERQRDRPVDQEQDDQHRGQRDQQQQSVDAGKGGAEVGDQAGRAGDVHLGAGARDASAAVRMPPMTSPSGSSPSASTVVTLSADSGTSTSAACPSSDGISGIGTGWPATGLATR